MYADRGKNKYKSLEEAWNSKWDLLKEVLLKIVNNIIPKKERQKKEMGDRDNFQADEKHTVINAKEWHNLQDVRKKCEETNNEINKRYAVRNTAKHREGMHKI